MTAQFSPVDPFDLVVFGGTGDLAMRKLLPGLYNRDSDGQLRPRAGSLAPPGPNRPAKPMSPRSTQGTVAKIAAATTGSGSQRQRSYHGLCRSEFLQQCRNGRTAG
jgi:hypothetical protein